MRWEMVNDMCEDQAASKNEIFAKLYDPTTIYQLITRIRLLSLSVVSFSNGIIIVLMDIVVII